jgi:hypothetical protein
MQLNAKRTGEHFSQVLSWPFGFAQGFWKTQC